MIEGHYPLHIVESAYVKGARVNWDDKKDPIKSPEDQGKIDLEAKEQLRNIFAEVLEEDEDDETGYTASERATN